MRELLLASLCLFSAPVFAATPSPAAPAAGVSVESASLRGIAGWLREHGREGWIGADVAAAMGIPHAAEAMLPARQRGFRSADVLRIAQLSGEAGSEFLLFMVQRPDDQVYFYLSTPGGGLRKALVSIPSESKVVPLERMEAELRFRQELHYWTDRSGAQ